MCWIGWYGIGKWLCSITIVIVLSALDVCAALSQEPEPIQIGVLSPWTGQMSIIGQQQRNGAEIATNQINSEGGLLGRSVTVLLADNQGDPSLTPEMTRQLIAQGVDVIVGGLSSAVTAAAAPIAEAASVPLIAPLTTDAAALVSQWAFSASYDEPFLGEMQAKYIAGKLACQRPAQLVDTGNERVKALGETIRAYLGEMNVRLVAQESFLDGDEDFRTQLNAIKAQQPDCLNVPAYSSAATLVQSQMNELGLSIPLISGLGLDQLQVEPVSFAAPPASGSTIIALAHFTNMSPDANAQLFAERYKTFYGREAPSAAALAYDAVMLYRAAVERAGTTDGRVVRDALASLKNLKSQATTPLFSVGKDGAGIKAVPVLELRNDGMWYYRDTIDPPATASESAVETSFATLPLHGRLTFAGSTTVQPLAAKLGEAFQALHPDVTLDIAAGGSVVGIQAVQDGTVDIGMASRELKPGEKTEDMHVFKVALDVIAIVVNEANPIRELTLEQLEGIYSGQITNWAEVGGLFAPITVYIREKSSGTRGAFDHLVLKDREPSAPDLHVAITAGDVAAAVRNNPAAIGYLGFGNIEPGLAVLSINGVVPSVETLQRGTYPLFRPLQLLTGPLSQPLALNFVDFVLSPEGQQIVAANGWVPIANVP